MRNRSDTSLKEAAGAGEVRRALAERVRRLTDVSGGTERVEVPTPDFDRFAWLRAQPAPRGYWRGRGADAAHAFSGVAERFEDPARLCAHLADHPAERRYYGGGRFDAERPAEGGWAPFGPGAFVLPRLELTQRESGETVLACHLTSDDDPDAVAAHVEQMPLSTAASDASMPALVRRRNRPEESAWTNGVEQALAAFAEGALRKVVLARRATLAFERAVAPVALLRRLVRAAPEAFHFLFQPARAGAFLGATPERLFRQRGRRVRSEAVAGTRPRADADADDDALQKSLLQSDKDRREHAFVQDYVRRVLETLGAAVEEEAPSAMNLRRGRHLRARLEGRFQNDVAPAEVLRALHPTPAVGGVPTPGARRFIRRHEPFDRGWYAGPVGWIGVEEGMPAAEVAVGIRSGLVRGARLDLFSGAGLVEGSVPEKEWDEIEQKLGNFAAVLGLER